MKRISLSDAVEYLSKKFFGYDPVTFFERVRDHERVDPTVDGLARFLTDVASQVHEYETEATKEIEKLKKEVERLQKLLNKNPTNSHKPPSSEPHKKIKNSRELTGNPIGAQKGHEGSSHELYDHADVIHRCDIQKCIECGSSLKGAPDHEVIRKQTVDIQDGKMHVTEYQRVIKFCPRCGRWNRADEPIGLQKSRIIFGPNVKSIAVYFIVQQLLPFCRTQEILFDLFGVAISQGSICNFVREFGSKLIDWESQTKLALLAAPLNHVDETGMRCEKRGDYVHVICNELLTLLNYHPRRGKEAIDEIGVLPEYKGHLVHDAFSVYWNYGRTHSLCNGHILRELKYLSEEENQKWALKMSELLKLTLHELHQGQKRSFLWKRRTQNAFIDILKEGFKENGYAKDWKGRRADEFKKSWANGRCIKVPIYRQRKHSKSMSLLNRLRDHRGEVLAFALKPNIPFTNNQAERDFRMVKLKGKISGCFRSSEMAKSFLRVRSYLSTLRKQQLHLLENLVLVDICCT